MAQRKRNAQKKEKPIQRKSAKKIVCPMCSTRAKKAITPYTSTLLDFQSGKPIKINDSFYLQCTNKECEYSWVPGAEVVRIEDIVYQKSFHRLTGEQIKQLRESLRLGNKSIAARLLGMNSKAFIKLERNAGKHNFSTDLLIRLVAHNKENLRFLKDLKKKAYQFDVSDYETLSKSQGKLWSYEVSKASFQILQQASVSKKNELENDVFANLFYCQPNSNHAYSLSQGYIS